MNKLLSIAFLVLFALSMAGTCFAAAETTKPTSSRVGNTKCQEDCRISSNSTSSLSSCMTRCATPTPAK